MFVLCKAFTATVALHTLHSQYGTTRHLQYMDHRILTVHMAAFHAILAGSKPQVACHTCCKGCAASHALGGTMATPHPRPDAVVGPGLCCLLQDGVPREEDPGPGVCEYLVSTWSAASRASNTKQQHPITIRYMHPHTTLCSRHDGRSELNCLQGCCMPLACFMHATSTA
jgi:hypothetical protein